MPKYLVLDLETTGLYKTEDYVIEIGAIAIDDEFHKLSEFRSLIPVGMSLIDTRLANNEFVRNMHTVNGLLAELQAHEAMQYTENTRHTFPIHAYRQVQARFCSWLETCGYEKGKVIVCGHSIATFDVPIVEAQLPQIGAWFSHRTLDFGGIGRFLRELADAPLAKTPEMPHRALEDCEIELAEAQEILRLSRDAFTPRVSIHNTVTPQVFAPGQRPETD